ncbi:tumor necrosis factor b (TNF superfamily, member 2) [Trichomycterus rosablanca]|uniref:tumor necrosis factor b (TNF superfamily, member 2) n=1 Tax=Trichomycterus rosablanca TaxID=2290929 RepID=UPI002F35B10D
MENYKMTAVDVEAGMTSVYQTTVEPVKPAKTSVWKIIAVITVLVTCAVASALFTWQYMSSQSQSETKLHMELQRTATRADHQKMLTEISKRTQAAIHLHVSGNDEKKSLHWETDVDQSFSKGDLKLTDNAIVIPRDGLYFVYTQASYSVPCSSSEKNIDNSYTPLHHKVQWLSPTIPLSKKHYLLSGVKSTCETRTKEQMNDEPVFDFIYLGGVFQLYKGDRLLTETNHRANIEREGSKTFFGVFEL